MAGGTILSFTLLTLPDHFLFVREAFFWVSWLELAPFGFSWDEILQAAPQLYCLFLLVFLVAKVEYGSSGIGGRFSWERILDEVAASTKPLSTPSDIARISDAKTDLVTLLDLVEDQCIMLPLNLNSKSLDSSFPITIRYPSWELRSALFAKKPSTKTNNFDVAKSNGM